MRTILNLAAALALAAPSLACASEPIPYWASFRADEVNMRVGPGEDYRINWVYHRQHMPVKVLREMAGWLLVQDHDGARGWVMQRLVSHQRSAVVASSAGTQMHTSPGDSAQLAWRLAHGVVGLLGDCGGGWCKLNVGGRVGFVHQAALWGAGNP